MCFLLFRLPSVLALSVLGAVALPLAAQAAPLASAGLSQDCFDELENGKGDEIACAFPLRLTDQERRDLKQITREYLHDVTCNMTVRIARVKIEEAIAASEHVFQSPDQPVTCTVTVKGGTIDVKGIFAPRVVIKGDKAIQGTPGLGKVTGVSRVLWWPVAAYVNYGPGMRAGLLQVVNAYRDYARKKKSGSAH